jgi:adenylosuccinate lyase
MLNEWRQVEVAVLRAQADSQIVPVEWWREAATRPAPTVEDWQQATRACGHEIIGFLDAWCVEHVHIGITSSDITDTALSLRIRRTNDLTLTRLAGLQIDLTRMIKEHGGAARLGRTHGQAAAPMRLGHVLVRWLGMVERAMDLLCSLRRTVEVCMISGPVGSYLHVTPEIEAKVAIGLGLWHTQNHSQIITRDALAIWVAQMANIVSICEAIGHEFRLMQHSSVDEVWVRNGSSSSAMPHKNNPNRAERLSGLARLARSYYEPVAAGITQWHERDMAHSSVERVILPQLSELTDYALVETSKMLENAKFDKTKMHEALHAAEVEAHTHSAQTAFQLAGLSHIEAQKATVEAYRASRNLPVFIREVERHPSKPTFIKPTPNKIGE